MFNYMGFLIAGQFLNPYFLCFSRIRKSRKAKVMERRGKRPTPQQAPKNQIHLFIKETARKYMKNLVKLDQVTLGPDNNPSSFSKYKFNFKNGSAYCHIRKADNF